MTQWLEGRMALSVYYEDTDFSGYVYHANYLKYFERAREELVGLPYVRAMYERSLHFVVARIDMSFHLPAKHADQLSVATRMRLSASPVCVVEQSIWRGSAELVSAKLKLVAIDQTGEAVRLPPDVTAYFQSLADKNSPPSPIEDHLEPHIPSQHAEKGP